MIFRTGKPFSSLRSKFLAGILLVAVPVVVTMIILLLSQIGWGEEASRMFLDRARLTSRETLKQRIGELRNQAFLVSSILQKRMRGGGGGDPMVFARSVLENNVAINNFSLVEIAISSQQGITRKERFFLAPRFKEDDLETPVSVLRDIDRQLRDPMHREKDDIRVLMILHGRLVMKIANGFYDSRLNLLGMAVLSSPIGYGFCDLLKQTTGTEILLFTRRGYLEKTIFGNVPVSEFPARFERIVARLRNGEGIRETRALAGKRHSVQYLPLYGPDRKVIAILALAYPVEAYLRSITRNMIMLGVFFVLIIGAIMASTRYLLKAIIDPLHTLTEAADRLTRRDFTVTVPVGRGDEMGRLFGSFNKMTGSLRRYEELSGEFTQKLESEVERKTRELQAAYNVIKQDLMRAREVQQHILPKRLGELAPLEASVEYRPVSDLGGDIYDITRIGPARYRVFLADVTGHGVTAAMITMLIKSEYENRKGEFDDPGELLTALNRDFHANFSFLTSFFTCILLDLDLGSMSLVHASAGHPPQFVVSEQGIRYLRSTGKAAGVRGDTVYRSERIDDLGHGDRIILFSDGIYEEFNREGEMFGEDRLELLIEKFRHKLDPSDRRAPIRQLVSYIHSQVFYFIGSDDVNDDITVIGLAIP